MNTIGSTALTILEFILAFGALILLHEFGHYIFARFSKIQVEEFGIGYPPKMVRLFRAAGTDFTLNWIPFGGFCRMKGEDQNDTEPGSFMAARPINRFITLLGGSAFNLLLGFLLITYLFTRLGSPDVTRVQIAAVTENTPAAASGIAPGDIISSVNNVKIDSMDRLSAEISANLGQPIEIVVVRDGEEISMISTPREEWPENQGPLGITITNPTKKVTFFQAVPGAFLTTLDQGDRKSVV